MVSRETPSSGVKSKQDDVNLSEDSETGHKTYPDIHTISSDVVSDNTNINIDINFGPVMTIRSNDQFLWRDTGSADTDMIVTDTMWS
ncbi:hypothetical protein [Haloquadratum walsbyi]|uniref:Uncharacterized protein n=1 Tax=Haloquadratum walsbyi J07HQW2 TaxID=1238425 RepID=U1N043_9EURY|nr:hypothetical protein [Haloquadratum walsbyi]ERG96154.1 MAG: hypothetical protein J07HQW2_02624 [Haloquadratum walsbyi J07HQW2]